MKIHSQADTDIGRLRQKNEDSYECSDRLGVYLVADGMGGAAAGEVASQMAASMVRECIDERLGDRDVPDDPAQLVQESVREANRKVYRAARETPDYRGMGTTVSGVFIRNDRATAFHVGDSRIYRLRQGSLEQLSEDHSWVQEQVRVGRLSPEEARTHHLRNLITRVVGPEADVEVDAFPVDMQPGDVLLLCTDGLHGMLDDHEIERALNENRDDPRQAATELIDLANVAGGMDNITIVLLGVSA